MRLCDLKDGDVIRITAKRVLNIAVSDKHKYWQCPDFINFCIDESVTCKFEGYVTYNVIAIRGNEDYFKAYIHINVNDFTFETYLPIEL